MAVDPTDVDPGLRELVARAREEARELRPPGRGPLRTSISPEVGAVIMELLRDGTYAAAVAQIVAEDPDLADE